MFRLYIIYVSILINFISVIGLIYFNKKPILSFFSSINKKTWYVLLTIFCLALSIRIFIPSHHHIMYIDEPWYMEAAKNILHENHQGAYPKSVAWPFILSLSFRIFGVNNWVAIYTSIFLGAVTIFTMFFLGYGITQNKNLGLTASLMFSLFPGHIRWSATAEANVASIFFITAAVFFCFLYYRHKTKSLLWLSLLGISFTAQIRPENYILFFLFLSGNIIIRKKIFTGFNFSSILAWLTALAVSMPNLFHVMIQQHSTNWLEAESAGKFIGNNWSLHNLAYNSFNYGIYIFNSKFQPLIYSLFILPGLVYMLFKQTKEAFFLIVWFCLLWFVYFFSWFQTLGGGLDIYCKTRFFMSFYPITVIFVSYGLLLVKDGFLSVVRTAYLNKFTPLENAADFSRRSSPIEADSGFIPPAALTVRERSSLTTGFTLAGLMIIISLSFFPYVIAARRLFFSPARMLETRIPELAEKDISSECRIIAHNPPVLTSTTDFKVISSEDFLTNPDIQQNALSNNSCLLFYEDLLCFESAAGMIESNRIKNNFLIEPFISYKEGQYRYTFYKIKGNKNNDRPCLY